jgi:hypothetical protein
MPPREQPRQSYIPRARLELIVRIEDFGDTANPVPPAPKMPPHLRSGKRKGDAFQDKLRVEKQGSRYVLVSPGAAENKGPPQQQTKSVDQRTFRLDGIVPLRATVNRNGPRMADTLSLSLAFRDLPLDPRAIRSIAVQFWLGCITPDELADEAAGKRAVPCSDTFVDAFGRTRENLRFQGYVDDYEVTLNEGAPEVSLECTDNTRILIDQDAPAKLAVSPDKPLDEAVVDYLANFPQFVGLSVEYRPGGAVVPSLGAALAKTAFKPKLGPPPSGGGGGGKTSVWDYLTDLAGSIGLLVRFEGTTVIFQRPRTFYAGRGRARPDDPFRGRVLPTGRQIDSRLLVYGRNVEELGFKRKFSRMISNNVEVRCYSPRLGRTLVARYPVGKDDRQSKPVPGDKTDDKWRVVTVYGIEDEATLRAVAQGVYEQMGRAELTGKVVTKNLGSFGGSNLDPDLLDVQAGDSVQIEVQRDEPGLTAIGGSGGTGQAAAFLERLGFPPSFAAAYQSAIAHVGLPTTFRVRTAAIDWDFEQGVTLDFEVVNYVEVRASKELPAGEEIATSDPEVEPDRVQVEGG